MAQIGANGKRVSLTILALPSTTGMGRHRKYFTKEEKIAANRAKSKRHYEKSKETINRERRKIHRRAKKDRKSEPSPPSSKHPPLPKQPQQPKDTWLDQIHRVRRRYLAHIRDNVLTYMDALCKAFMKTKNLDDLRDHTETLSNFQGSVYRFQGEILQLEGVGDSWLKADVIVREVCCTLSWVEEIYCAALIEPQEVHSEYVKKRFLFQRA